MLFVIFYIFFAPSFLFYISSSQSNLIRSHNIHIYLSLALSHSSNLFKKHKNSSMAQESKILPRFHQQISPLEHHHRPMLLKDFLRDDASKSTALSSSKSNSSHIVLLRSWSRRAAATRISAVHKVIKLLQLASSKSPSVLPRSISRRLTKRGKEENDVVFGRASSSEVKVKVKDILRWRSFRDLAEDDPTTLHFPPSPYRSTATTTTATTCSKRSSWCDSDFTAEELPAWGGESEDFWGKCAAATLKNPKVCV